MIPIIRVSGNRSCTCEVCLVHVRRFVALMQAGDGEGAFDVAFGITMVRDEEGIVSQHELADNRVASGYASESEGYSDPWSKDDAAWFKAPISADCN